MPSFAGLYTRLQDLRFDDRFVRELPADPREDRGRRQVLGACHSAVTPTPVAAPRLLAYSEPLAAELGLAPALLHDPAFVAVLAGNAVLPGMRPFAACYGGHQFGNWAGQLGDGRAIGLGELVTPAGARVELQLKGAGPTPYSRAGDGRAVLRSSLREFACSEAMHHLGVPTTRALSLVTTGENVVRDMLYDGNPRAEPGAIVCRTAPSFLRFGNYEIFTSRGETDTLARLLEHTVRHHFPALLPTGSVADAQTWAAWFAEVCERTAAMVVHWMRVGFVHGVMNTDNMSVLGLTIDYGPYGWIDDFDLDWTPNTTDAATRRYRFGQQGQVAAWNLARLARAIAPLLPDTGALEQGLSRYVQRYGELQRRSLADKLGLHALVGDDDDPHGDVALVDELFATLSQTPTDMTIFFRRLGALATASFDASSWLSAVQHAWYDDPVDPAARARMLAWLRRWHERCARDGDEPARRRARMDAANPKYVLRNYLAQEAIDAATAGDLSPLSTLMTVLQHPYDEQPEHERLAAKRPEWARTRVGCSMLSCSS